jgi:hypothetical protein
MIQRQPGGYAGNRMKHENSEHPVFLHRDTARGKKKQVAKASPAKKLHSPRLQLRSKEN